MLSFATLRCVQINGCACKWSHRLPIATSAVVQKKNHAKDNGKNDGGSEEDISKKFHGSLGEMLKNNQEWLEKWKMKQEQKAQNAQRREARKKNDVNLLEQITIEKDSYHHNVCHGRGLKDIYSNILALEEKGISLQENVKEKVTKLSDECGKEYPKVNYLS